MARHTEAGCKICRNEGKKLFLKGDRCNSAKCSATKRPYGSGQHGQSRKKLSEYAVHLREKQKCRFSYLVSEKQFSRYFKIAAGKSGVTGTVLLQLLESRFDNVVAKAGFTAGRKQSRQLIRHRHFLINDRLVDIPSYRLKAGDKISVKKGSEELIKSIIDSLTPIEGVNWLEYDKSSLKITVKSLPEREEIDPTVKEQLIVEYYSK